ncbi:laminin subunit alpha-5 isoform X3 [Alligator mississippiensis]|uniref:laminin subunit alpha-5 isoform X3 n=1 Tax=Alligator mississippiensis TaxID=8496 RepID=UPI002877D636|nr:laminin subunit alpha-5 isoform X3 [Alligator mississippiensis]
MGPARLRCALAALLLALPAPAGGHSLHPPYFNLAESTRIAATATCGEDGGALEDLYCKLVGGPVAGGDPHHTIQGQYCDICSSANSNKAHPISNAIDGTERWWQSPPLSRGLEFNEVNVTLDLGQLFHVAYVLIKFANSPRPDLWVLEHSTDFGLTYEPWQYFASSRRDCIEKFGPRTVERVTKDDDAICTTEYSRIVPLENGEIVVSLVNGRPGAMNFTYSPLLRNFTKATNIRLRFLRTNTLLGHLMGKALRDPTVTRRYYYSIKDISIGGRCVCHGHADVCDAKDPNDPYRLQCDCQHNTCGGSCDRCCPGFNQVPWKPATSDSANECQPCNCNGHAYDCYYDPEVDHHKASKSHEDMYEGGGVCIDCQHHTTGINCERCISGYYKSPDHPIDSPYICYRCNCDSEFTDGTCEDLTGRCYCKPNYTGERCDACAEGYIDFPHCYPVPAFSHNDTGEQVLPAGQIINCDCYAAGTEGNACRKDSRTGVCVCKPNFQGAHCDQCAPGHYGPSCQPCQCSGPGQYEGTCDSETGQCLCRSGFEGQSCNQCAPGYFSYPLCQLCGCSAVGTLPGGCDSVGRCFCKPEFDGPHCDRCSTGYHSYPHCHACSCDPRGSVDNTCSPAGQCRCHLNFAGHTCSQCAPGFYGYPSCTPCQCSAEGSLHGTCDQEMGQCSCRPKVTGLRCDTCVPGAYGFPHCEVGSCNPAGLESTDPSLPLGSCACRAYVEGPACDRCKPLYWNLTPENPYGCTSCQCNTKGTISGVAECQQGSGQCFCKPNICGQLCSTCKDGYFKLNRASYFGCQGCQCDVGGSVGPSCEKTGACHCRPNTRGPTCTQPAKDHYFPDLHHLKLELEEGTTPDGRAVRFGYNPLEFENFSWRGYAQMSPIQNKVRVTVAVKEAELSLFHVILRYINSGGATVYGKITAFQPRRRGTEQTKQIVFAPSTEPAFVTVPQNSFGEPFVLNPSVWSLIVEAEGILLDYLVLLPSSYYEAPILQLKVTEACTYRPSPEQASRNCLLYKYLSADGFPSASGADAVCRIDNNLPRPCPVELITPSHPRMVLCSGSDVEVQVRLPIPQPGKYVVLVEYANTDGQQTAGVAVTSPQQAPQQGTSTFYTCDYSFLCRGMVVDSENRLATFELRREATVRFTADRAHVFLHKVYLIPHRRFTMEFVEPKVHCISLHGTFSPNSSSCVPSRFPKLSQSIVLEGGQPVLIPLDLPLTHAFSVTPTGPTTGPPPRPPTAVDSSAELILLQPPQTAVVFNTRIQTLGRYTFILHCYQPNHPTFPVEVLINGGRIWQGQANATFCPHGYGCRSLVVAENHIVLDVTDNDLSVIIRVPEDRQLWLDYILVVPEDSYSSQYLQEEPLDKSYDFISTCGVNGFYINPATSPRFCKDSAISLSLFYNNGAQPCRCHEVGAVSRQCEPFGGQCTCKSNVIGRECSRCATGYWGFPNCRPCDCGLRLCNEVTGQCICPPHTIKPECVVCEPQTFGCHPLVGCEDCNCSRPGVQELTEPGCDVDSGQCRCKPNVIGRRCNLCAPGYYHFPDCRSCNCHPAGTEASVCDPVTGQCHCKENVEGPRCDQCRLGTFLLDADNPKGCTKCFCFGATDRCHSVEKYRVEFSDMNGWRLLSSDRQEVGTSLRAEEDLVHADLKYLLEVYQELYWQAPSSYLGDRVSSYGGHLRYELHSDARRGDVFVPMESRPDVILKGNQMSIMFREDTYPPPGDVHRGQLQLVEGNFRHTETHNPVSREELMMVLASLEQLQIRALFSQISSSIFLRRVILETVTDSAVGIRASNVELCLCPANYRGDSCQECAPGYYRDTKGLFLGKCVPCHCNGHSDQCLPGSGICINCQHNTEGNRCERCKDGYVDSYSPEGLLQCVGCPCPLSVASNNFAVGCIRKGSTMQCLCKTGYAGAMCERCAPGYYGNPLVIGSFCQPCDCSGNTDPNMLFSDCDPLTGACSGCMHHTAGPRCELCAPGYHGDAVEAKNCTLCSCSPCGTESCDPRTGRCLCKAGVTGQHCDRCQEGYYGYDSCSGCRRCDCDVGSLGASCHTQTGQCSCQPGVNGARCHQCAPGYWGLGENGCTKCQCKGGSCDPRTGECTCPSGLTGKQCDTCIQQYEIPVASGPDSVRCEVCDTCVLLLLEDLRKIEASFPTIRNQLINLNASSIAWARLQGLKNTMETLANHLREHQRSMSGVRQRAEELVEENRDLTQDLNALQHKMTMTHRKANSLDEHTKNTYQRVQQLLLNIRSIQNSIQELGHQMDMFGTGNVSATSTEEFRQKMAEVERMLKEMRERDFSSQRGLAENEEEEAQKLLHRVQNELHSKGEANRALVNNIRDRLTQYNSELMDLRDALNEAVNKTRQTEDLNSMNLNNLEESQRKKKELQKQHGLVQDTLRMAEDSLAQVSDLLQMIERAKEDYEKLAALLDGAKHPLTERVKKFSPASSKIPVVEAAEEHARFLDELARNLSSIIRSTNQDGFIQRAIDASNAYASIIEAVKKAETAAADAADAASEALMGVVSGDLAAIAKKLKRNSSALEEAVRQEQRKLSGPIKGTLQAAREKVTDLRARKDRLVTRLRAVQDMLEVDQDGTKEAIQNAKDAAAKANETAARVQDTLNSMKKNLDEWKDQYGDLRNEDLHQAVQDAKKSVSSLESTIPLLLGKLSNLENRKNKNATVSENIVRIRQLITQARNAASKVKVPMKFNGQSGVQVRSPSDLPDLAAYTSLKFYIQNPEPSSASAPARRQGGPDEGRFVLYLGSKEGTGDYMGVVLKDRKVQWVYQLGDEEPTFLTIDEEIGEQFAVVSINRILQYGHMSVTMEKKTLHETKGDSVAKGEQGLFNFDLHSVVFYVGGYPSSFMPPATLHYPGYQGCIELDTLNEEVVSLYNFHHTFHLDTATEKPCARSKSTGDPWLTDGSYFDGTGYAEIKFESQIGPTKRFEQEMRMVSYNGILFFLEHEGQFLCLAVQDGKLVLYYDFSDGLKVAESNNNLALLTVSSTTNKAVQIYLLKMDNKKRILVRLERLTIFIVEQENSLENAVSYYLGGVPLSVLPESLKAIFPKGGSIRGCMKGLKALGKYVDLKRMTTTGVSYGCTSDLLVARSVKLHGHGYLTLSLKNVPPLQDFYTGFSFRTSQSDGLLYYHATAEGKCQVSLKSGQLALEVLRTALTTQNTYADDSSHYVAVYSDASGVRLYVDDELQEATQAAEGASRQGLQEEQLRFQLGGLPETGALSNLTGCIGNVFVRRKSDPQMVVDLQQNVESFNVTMSCPRDQQPQQMQVSPKKDRRKPKGPSRPSRLALKGRRQSQEMTCLLPRHPRAARGAFQFGGFSMSRLEFDDIPESFQEKSYFSMEVRLNATSGLLFYVASEQPGSFMAVLVSNGRFVLLADLGGNKLRIQSKDKYHDRRWHTVFFSRDGRRAQLVIDGLKAQDATMATAGQFLARGPFYVGGVPPRTAKAHVRDTSVTSFSGCLRNLKLDQHPLPSPSRTFGVTRCYEGALESGVFFAAEGGHVTLANAVSLEQDISLKLEVRPRSAAGLIFHIGRTRSYLSLSMDDKKVLLKANSGAGEFSTWVAHPALCDGQWHAITVTKQRNMIHVAVDRVGNNTVGPSQTHWAEHKEPLHVGRMPETTKLGAASPSPLTPLPHYIGCIRNLMIDQHLIDLPGTATVRGSVGLRGCPVL